MMMKCVLTICILVELLQFLPEQIYFEILMYYLSVHELYLGGGIHKAMFQRLDHRFVTIGNLLSHWKNFSLSFILNNNLNSC